MTIIIAAIAKNGVIGKDGKLPWLIKKDLEFFKNRTLDNIVIMGKNTYLSLPKSFADGLPGRINYIVSKSLSLPKTSKITRFDTLEDALDKARQASKPIYLIGGSQLYRYALDKNLADMMLITHIDKDYDGDTLFPGTDWSQWDQKLIEEYKTDNEKVKVIEYVKAR